MKYFPPSYFPASYFGEAERAEGEVVNIAAVLSGNGALSGSVQAAASLACDLVGFGALQGWMAVSSRQTILSGGVSVRRKRRRKTQEQHVFVDLAMLSNGNGELSGRLEATSRAGADIGSNSSANGQLSATADIGMAAQGFGEMSATPVVDITRLLKRKREEEIIAWLLVG